MQNCIKISTIELLINKSAHFIKHYKIKQANAKKRRNKYVTKNKLTCHVNLQRRFSHTSNVDFLFAPATPTFPYIFIARCQPFLKLFSFEPLKIKKAFLNSSLPNFEIYFKSILRGWLKLIAPPESNEETQVRGRINT